VVACQPATSALGHVEDENEVLSDFTPAELATPTSLDSSILAITQTPISLLAEESAPEPTGMPDIQLCSPLSMHPIAELPQIISDPYKPPPPNRPEERHHGVDFGYWHYEDRDSMLGELVQAILPGVVASAIQDLYPYGNMVIIETSWGDLPSGAIAKLQIKEGESLYHLYAHMNLPPAVGQGETVTACQPLGEVGMSGNTDIPHLHLETRLGPAGSVFESMRFYDTRASIEEMETYLLWRTSEVYRHFDPMILLNYPVFP
jgi:murein DD-endopeptidase MepM/ murein hydrolase activator NlpD